MGWVDDMHTLMQAVDLIVENAGGLTCQQALAAGLPTITYRPLPATAEPMRRCSPAQA